MTCRVSGNSAKIFVTDRFRLILISKARGAALCIRLIRSDSGSSHGSADDQVKNTKYSMEDTIVS